jgi:hypothetical protein
MELSEAVRDLGKDFKPYAVALEQSPHCNAAHMQDLLLSQREALFALVPRNHQVKLMSIFEVFAPVDVIDDDEEELQIVKGMSQVKLEIETSRPSLDCRPSDDDDSDTDVNPFRETLDESNRASLEDSSHPHRRASFDYGACPSHRASWDDITTPNRRASVDNSSIPCRNGSWLQSSTEEGNDDDRNSNSSYQQSMATVNGVLSAMSIYDDNFFGQDLSFDANQVRSKYCPPPPHTHTLIPISTIHLPAGLGA